jgi:hypothetical protein
LLVLRDRRPATLIGVEYAVDGVDGLASTLLSVAYAVGVIAEST